VKLETSVVAREIVVKIKKKKRGDARSRWPDVDDDDDVRVGDVRVGDVRVGDVRVGVREE